MNNDKKVGTFDVLKTMCDRNMDVRLSTLDNVRELKKIKGGTQITIGFSGDILKELYFGKFVGGFLIADKEQFMAVSKELKEKK